MLRVQRAPDLGIREVKPAIEQIRGRRYQKVSPKTAHSLLQARLAALLLQWAGERGVVGTEWRYYFLPEGEKPSSLVPDVAYLSYERMPPPGELREKPTIAPDVAVEILSPKDRRTLLETKIEMYRTFGTKLAIVVDPETRTVTMHEAAGTQTFAEPAAATSAAYPDLRIGTIELFARL
jgi:Uma2 family endonuclease